MAEITRLKNCNKLLIKTYRLAQAVQNLIQSITGKKESQYLCCQSEFRLQH